MSQNSHRNEDIPNNDNFGSKLGVKPAKGGLKEILK